MAKKNTQWTQVGKRKLELSNLDKVLFPEDGIVKAEVIAYYLKIAPTILNHIKGRALTMIRFPDGIHGESFYQKNRPEWAPDWIESVPVVGQLLAAGVRTGQAPRHGYIVLAPAWTKEHQSEYEYSFREHAAVMYSLRDACRRDAELARHRLQPHEPDAPQRPHRPIAGRGRGHDVAAGPHRAAGPAGAPTGSSARRPGGVPAVPRGSTRAATAPRRPIRRGDRARRPCGPRRGRGIRGRWGPGKRVPGHARTVDPGHRAPPPGPPRAAIPARRPP